MFRIFFNQERIEKKLYFSICKHKIYLDTICSMYFNIIILKKRIDHIKKYKIINPIKKKLKDLNTNLIVNFEFFGLLK